jgi:hypothetical protein
MQFDKNHNIVLEYQPYFKHLELLRIYDPENGGPHYGLYTPNYYSSCFMKQEQFSVLPPRHRASRGDLTYYPHMRVYR